MPGLGKYNKYASPLTRNNIMLNKLFRGNEAIQSPIQDLVGQENDARLQTIERAKEFLTPTWQQGDLGYFPNGVNLDYSGEPNGISAPKLGGVTWKKAGDPALQFAPDLRSPGPGSVSAESADNLQTNPEISISDIKGPGYIPGAPKTSTIQPGDVDIASTLELGVALPLGKSSP